MFFRILIINLYILEDFQLYKKKLKVPNRGKTVCCVSLEGNGSFSGEKDE